MVWIPNQLMLTYVNYKVFEIFNPRGSQYAPHVFVAHHSVLCGCPRAAAPSLPKAARHLAQLVNRGAVDLLDALVAFIRIGTREITGLQVLRGQDGRVAEQEERTEYAAGLQAKSAVTIVVDPQTTAAH